MLTALTDGRHFSYIELLREAPLISELFDMDSVVRDSTLRRFFKSVDSMLGAQWIARDVKLMRDAMSDRIIMDWALSLQPNYGHYEGASIGYNPGNLGLTFFPVRFWVRWGAYTCVRRICSAVVIR